ncbi:hypothetical protein LT493_27920 [Streptomyces tricolor]|nr:hypothetical protein [Streptomyces tricolor]
MSYLRLPHLSGDLLCFVAEDDLWLAPPRHPRPRLAAHRGPHQGRAPALLARRPPDRLHDLAQPRPRDPPRRRRRRSPRGS